MSDEQSLPTEDYLSEQAKSGGGFGDMINYLIAAVLFMVMGAMLTMLFLDNTVSEDELREIVAEVVAEHAVSDAELRAALDGIAVAQGGNNQQPQQAQPPAVVEEDLSDDDPFWGPENAPITIVEFSDFFCPFCGRHAAQTIPQLQEAYGEQVKYVYRDFPGVGGERAYDAAIAAQCAGDQGYYWEYHMLLFENQSELQSNSGDGLRDVFIRHAESLDINIDVFAGCYDEEEYLTDVNLDRADGQRYGVSGTPTFFINGQRLVGAQPFSAFASIIDRQLAELEETEG